MPSLLPPNVQKLQIYPVSSHYFVCEYVVILYPYLSCFNHSSKVTAKEKFHLFDTTHPKAQLAPNFKCKN